MPNINNVNPTGTGEKVDVVIIGAGPGGYDLAIRLGKMGLKVVSIEERFAGGVCLNIGCIPTKALLKGAKEFYRMKHANDLGISLDIRNVKLNWKKMQERKTKISKTLENGVEFLFKGAKVNFVKGRATIVDKHNVKVGKTTYTTKYIVIATGSSPILLEKLPGFEVGLKSGAIVDSTGALAFDKIPKSLAIVGGGVIGVEFAVMYKQFGTEVTILEGTNSILGPLDGETKKVATKVLEEMGINIKLGVKVVGYEKGRVVYQEGATKKKLKADKTLVSVGRKPNNMDLDKSIGLKLTERGAIDVNEIMQTSIPNIFAIGDVVGHSMLAHTAYRHAMVVQDAFNGIYKPYDQNKIPGVVYIFPEISSIGKTEEELKAKGTEYLVASWKNTAVGRALAENDTIGFTKLLFEPKYGKILGAHIINHSSSEMITEIGTLMELEGTVFELGSTTHPHPTSSEGIYEAATIAIEKLERIHK